MPAIFLDCILDVHTPREMLSYVCISHSDFESDIRSGLNKAMPRGGNFLASRLIGVALKGVGTINVCIS